MPTYEFVCPNGHHFDKFYRRISGAASELPCPECGKIAERQISGGAGLLFKGSGFYITDYGKDGKKGMSPPAHSSGGHAGSSESTAPGAATGGDSKSSEKSGSASSSAGTDSGTSSK